MGFFGPSQREHDLKQHQLIEAQRQNKLLKRELESALIEWVRNMLTLGHSPPSTISLYTVYLDTDADEIIRKAREVHNLHKAGF